jgi:hypothetical protein
MMEIKELKKYIVSVPGCGKVIYLGQTTDGDPEAAMALAAKGRILPKCGITDSDLERLLKPAYLTVCEDDPGKPELEDEHSEHALYVFERLAVRLPGGCVMRPVFFGWDGQLALAESGFEEEVFLDWLDRNPDIEEHIRGLAADLHWRAVKYAFAA